MQIKPLILFISIILVACNNVSSGLFGDSSRPYLNSLNEWPDTLVIEAFYYGGMSPESEQFTIRKDSVIAKYNHGNTSNTYSFAPQQKDLNELLKKLNEYNIDKLEVEKSKYMTYDAPTRGININFGHKSINISNGATEEISEKNEGDFQNIYGLLSGFAAKALEGKMKNLCISIDLGIKKSSGMLSIITESSNESYYDSIPKLKDKYCVVLPTGNHTFQIHITEQGKNYYTKYKASLYPALKISNDTNLRLILKNDSTLVLE